MISFSEIETTVKRATRSVGFSWGISEEVGKNIRLLEMFGLPGVKNINKYFITKCPSKMGQLRQMMIPIICAKNVSNQSNCQKKKLKHLINL